MNNEDRNMSLSLLENLQCGLVDRFGLPAGLRHTYAGHSAILIAGGPSLLEHLPLLQKHRPLMIGVNNTWSLIEPDVWCCVDHPKRFEYNGWINPRIMKFCPIQYAGKRLNKKCPSTGIRKMRISASRAPNSFFYMPTTGFVPNAFFHKARVCVGNDSKQRGQDGQRGGRNVILAAVKIAHYLGLANLTIVGMDLHMDKSKAYAFDAFSNGPSDEYVRHFNANANKLAKRLALLEPVAKRDGLVLRMVGNGPLASESIQDALSRCTPSSPVGADVRDMYTEEV